MTPDAWITVVVIVLTLAALISEKISAEVVMLTSLTALLLTEVLTPAQGLAGFANEGMVTVAAMYVIAAGLRETGAIDLVTTPLFGNPRTDFRAQFRLMMPVLFSSSFINNTPVVATFLPAVLTWAKRIRIAPSKLLIPLSYASILGGVCTLLGTSTNLIVDGLWRAAGYEGFGMFDISLIGIPCALAGLLFMMTIGGRLLPTRSSGEQAFANPREYTIEMLVDGDGPLVGKTIIEAGLRNLGSVFLIDIEREGRVVPAVNSGERLLADDRLVFAGDVSAIVELKRIRGLKPALDEQVALARNAPERKLVEVVISPRCPLIHQTLRQSRFHTYYGASVVAVAREGQRVTGALGEIEIRPADTLLVEARPVWVERHRQSPDFLLISEVENSQPPRYERALIAWAILAAVVITATFEWLPMVVAAFVGGGLMFATGCVTLDGTRKAIDYQVLTVIACSFALGKALDVSGVADIIASLALQSPFSGPWVVLGIVYLVTLLLTEIVTNNAAAALMFPICLSLAESLGVSPMPFMMVLMVAASCGFATPLGYQTHLMVMGPGGYRFTDFLRIGIPLDIVVGIVAVAVAPLVYPF